MSRTALLAGLRGLIGAIALIWCVYVLIQTDTAWLRDDVALPALLFFVAWLVLAHGMGMAWIASLEALSGQSVDRSTAYRIHAVAWLGRYVPGKVANIVPKVTAGPELGLPHRTMVVGSLIEQLGFVATGLLVGLALVPALWLRQIDALDVARWQVLGVLVLLVALVVLGAMWLAWRRLVTKRRNGSWRWIKPAAIYIGLHGLLGITALPLISTIDTSLQAFGPQEAISAVALSNVSGALFLIAPAGLGAREAVFAFLVHLGGHGSMEALLQAAAAMRVISMVADGSYFVAVRAAHVLSATRTG